MDKENTRNTIVFFGIALVLMAVYQLFVFAPMQKRQQEIQARAKAVAVMQAANPTTAPAPVMGRAEALAATHPLAIDTPSLRGSIALKGGRLDDLFLKAYPETVAKNSPPVELFRPEGAPLAYFADFGWAGATPTAQVVWTPADTQPLTPTHPVTLTYDNGQGLVFTRRIAVDDKFMFTVTNTVLNKGAAPLQLAPYATIQRQGQPQLTPIGIIHEGGIGVLGEGQDAGRIPLISGSTHTLRLQPFKSWKKTGETEVNSTGGWIGITDHYWLSALIPDQSEAVRGKFTVTTVNNIDVFESNYTGAPRTLAPGQQTSETTHLFAGAKNVALLKNYAKTLRIPRFDDAVDWGFEWFLTKPIFILLEFFHKLIGNFGVAILLLTLVVKAFLFPIANRAFASMSKMKKLQPEMEAIKKRFPDEPAKQQQETMALYQREKINPIAGCLPVLIQIPIFYALYKVLYVTLEMRHAPFFGWIHDLSAPDPTAWANLFGLIPWNPANVPLIGSILAIGVWPLAYGFMQWLTTQMSPQATTDPTQKLMMQLFPLVFTVLLAHSPSGILIYWTWSSFLTIVQQYVIMHQYKAENPIDDLIARLRNRSTVAKV